MHSSTCRQKQRIMYKMLCHINLSLIYRGKADDRMPVT